MERNGGCTEEGNLLEDTAGHHTFQKGTIGNELDLVDADRIFYNVLVRRGCQMELHLIILNKMLAQAKQKRGSVGVQQSLYRGMPESAFEE